MTTIAHYTSDRKHISCPLLFYVYSLFQSPRLVRWFAIFLWQFCIALDRCRSQTCGRLTFPFPLELFCLFFERFLETRPTFVWQPRRPMLNVRMQMWGQMMPKRGLSNYPSRISIDALELLASGDDNSFFLVPCPYAGLDWRGCTNILFRQDESMDDRGNISVLFKLIQFHFIVLINQNYQIYSKTLFNLFY